MRQDYYDESQLAPQSADVTNTANATEELVAGASPYATLEEGLKAIFGEAFDIKNVVAQQALLKHIENNKEQNEKLAAVIETDPRLAQMLVDIVNGKRNAHSALARYYGSSMGQLSEDSPEYEEMMQADEERREELMRAAAERRDYENNLQSSRAIIENFCKERGYEPADFMNRVWDSIVMPILSGNYSHEVCVALDNALNYEQDVENAFVAGDIKGRNTNIQRLKENFGDGMPKGLNSASNLAQPKRKVNSLIEDALNA